MDLYKQLTNDPALRWPCNIVCGRRYNSNYKWMHRTFL